MVHRVMVAGWVGGTVEGVVGVGAETEAGRGRAVARNTTNPVPPRPHNPPAQPGALPPLLTQLNTASTPSAVKEAAVRALDSIIRSSEEHASVVCNPEVREGGTEGGRRWTCLLSAVRSAKAL